MSKEDKMDIELAQALKEIADLKKENAELKDYAIQLKQAAVKRDEELTKQLLEFDKERTKAKEIIKELLDLDLLPEIEIKKTAENFIKEGIAYVKYQ